MYICLVITQETRIVCQYYTTVYCIGCYRAFTFTFMLTGLHFAFLSPCSYLIIFLVLVQEKMRKLYISG